MVYTSCKPHKNEPVREHIFIWFHTKTCFEREAKGNPEIAYCVAAVMFYVFKTDFAVTLHAVECSMQKNILFTIMIAMTLWHPLNMLQLS